MAAGIKKYKTIIKKNKKKHDKIVLLAKSKLKNVEVLISKVLIESNISHGEFVLINNVLKEYDDMKEEVKNFKTLSVYQRFSLFIKQCYCIVLSVGGAIKNKIMSNKELAEALYKPVIRQFEKLKVYSSFIDSIWGADLANMQLISKFNIGFRFLLCVIDIFSKYTLVIPLKDKKGITITNVFQKFLDKSNHKLNKIWVDKGSEFYNRSMKSWLEKMYRNVFNIKRRKICCC